MSAVEHALASWSRTATDNQLENGPTLDDLGGPGAVAAEAARLAGGPLLGILATATAHSLTTHPGRTFTPITQALQHGLAHPHSAWTLAECLDTLCNHAALLQSMEPKHLSRLLAGHAESALRAQASPHIARPALAGLLHLVITGRCNPRQLLLILTDLDATEPSDALEMLPVLLGVAHSHFGDPDLLTSLTRIENHASLPAPLRADACFELALAQIKKAAGAVDGPQAQACLDQAALRLHHVIEQSEARPDARAWLAATQAVLAFTPTSPHQLDTALDHLQHATAHHQAWTARLGDLPWLAARGIAQAAWLRLTTRLHRAAAHLAEPSWYEAARTLADVLDIYSASRAVHTSGPTSGLHALIHPTVVDAFTRNTGLLHHLRQAIEHDFTHHPDAIALRQAAEESINSFGAPSPNPSPPSLEQDNPLPGYPQLHDMLTSANPDPLLFDSLERSLIQRRQASARHESHLFDKHLETLLSRLKQHPAFTHPTDGYLSGLVEHFLKFLYLRFDATPNLYGDSTAYLGPPPPGHPTRFWTEKALQDDYHRDLVAAFPHGTIHREQPDRGGGRSDLEYEPQPGMRFPIEIKRRTTPFTHNDVQTAYLAQTATYTATSVPFALLLVGDHSGHSSGSSHVQDRVWTTLHARSPTELPRLIVIGVLPIGRATPSHTR
ncbi:hypothetical protein ACFWM7_10100 [Streptomyces sp. NPDC058375]|uniref:hypothetical protein n=1 Tax=Streptomyces sp. NPDC058375 TaxID=3346467 RepID=UPI0036485DEE